MALARFTLPSPPGFAFWPTVCSHGWFDLAPFSADTEHRTLAVTLELSPGRLGRLRLAGAPGGVRAELETARRTGARELAVARAAVVSVLRLDHDLEPFYRALEREPAFGWVRPRGAGRLLRAASAWEDLVKLLLTTNCSWALTRSMTRNLVEAAGADGGRLGRAFPGAAALAHRSERWFRDVVRCGYRASALRELSARVAAGELDPERWRDPAVPREQIEREIASVRGAGPYVVGNLLRLVGSYEKLALDSWARAKWARLRGRTRASDAMIHRAYRSFGPWAGLALWMELTEDWFSREGWTPT